MTQLVKKFTYVGVSQTFTMPSGFKSDVQVYMWGAGGGAGGADGNGPGGPGCGGAWLARTVTINAGDTVRVAVGGAGHGGGTSGGAGGHGLKGFSVPGLNSYGNGRSFAGADGGSMGPSGWSGGGGGGGAATVLTINNTAYVAGGGGGGGGGSHNRAGAGAPPINVPSDYTELTRYTNSAYTSWLNTNGIWNQNVNSGSFTQTWTIYFPTTTTYTIQGACDNYGAVDIDGTQVLTISGFGTTYSNSVTVTAGHHSVRLRGTNTGGPGSIAAQISAGSTTVFSTATLPRLSNGAEGQRTGGDGGGGGGGGGGITGGAGGAAGGDNSSGGGGGYCGSSTSGAMVAIGAKPSGTTSGYWTSPAGQGGASTSEGGSHGLLVMVFTPASIGHLNVGGTWRNLQGTSVKVNGAWRQIQSAWVKVAGQWKELKGGAPTAISASNSGSYGVAVPTLPYTTNSRGYPGLASQQSLS